MCGWVGYELSFCLHATSSLCVERSNPLTTGVNHRPQTNDCTPSLEISILRLDKRNGCSGDDTKWASGAARCCTHDMEKTKLQEGKIKPMQKEGQHWVLGGKGEKWKTEGDKVIKKVNGVQISRF